MHPLRARSTRFSAATSPQSEGGIELISCASYVLNDAVAYLAITERSYPKKLALTYLEDVRAEFQTSYKREDIHDPQLRPYQYSEFDRFIERTKKTYQDSRATDNLSRLNDELKDVTQVMTKNIEDLLYRGDSLEKMGMQRRD